MMMTKMRWLIAAALGLAIVWAGVGAGVAMTRADDTGTPPSQAGTTDRDATDTESGENEGSDSDEPLAGSDADRAAAAALAHTGGGTVLEVEMGDDGAAYGVEVRKDDGSTVEVHLDERFSVTGEEADGD